MNTRSPAARSSALSLKPADAVSTAPVVAAGLIGGWLIARETGIRPLGGVALGAAGLYAGRTWLARRGAATTAVLGATYVLGFGLSHRSEEHTSELQSRGHLVCRLLLEKKKTQE